MPADHDAASHSSDDLLRRENDDLRAATSQNSSMVLDLDLDGRVRYLSKNWEDLVGTPLKKIIHKPVCSIILGSEEDQQVFQQATDVMLQEDTSFRVRFTTRVGSLRQFEPKSDNSDDENLAANSAIPSAPTTPPLKVVSTPISISTTPKPGTPSAQSTHDISPSFSSNNSPISENSEGSVSGSSSGLDPYHPDLCIELEGQGLLIKEDNRPSHTMWILRPYMTPQALSIALPDKLVKDLGDGAHFLVSFLEELSDSILMEKDTIPAPPLELCRICERHVPKWWFERHSDLCVVENRAESVIQETQENLLDHRTTLASLISTCDTQLAHTGELPSPIISPSSSLSSFSSSSPDTMIFSPTPYAVRDSGTTSGSSPQDNMATNFPRIEYKGFEIASPFLQHSPDVHGGNRSPPRSPRLNSTLSRRVLQRAVGTASPPPNKRAPLKIMELLLELCDMAWEIKIPEVKYEKIDTEREGRSEDHQREDIRIRTFSPVSETRIHQVLDWTYSQSEDPGMALLCEDTAHIAKQKVDAVVRLGSILVYAEKVRLEVEAQVQHIINEIVSRTVNIADGDDFDNLEAESEMEQGVMIATPPYTNTPPHNHRLLLTDEHDTSTDMDSDMGENTVIIYDKSGKMVVDEPDARDTQRGSEQSNTTDEGSFFSSSYLHTEDVPSSTGRKLSSSALSPMALPESKEPPPPPLPQLDSLRRSSITGTANDARPKEKVLPALRTELVTPHSFLEIATPTSSLTPTSSVGKSPIFNRHTSVSTNLSLSPLNDFQRRSTIAYNDGSFFSSPTDNEEFALSEGLADLDLNASGSTPALAGGPMGVSIQRIRSRRSFGSSNVSPRAYSSSPLSSMQRHRIPPATSVGSSGDVAAFSPSVSYAGSPLILPHDPERYHHHRRQSSMAVDFSRAPVSPLMSASAPPSKPAPPSIRDYEIICPISKGAFGSVYLSKKKLTGEYFAIKVLKKADMIAKNQVMNVKSERAIMMAQADSPFVAKLFFTFQSKEYLFLVMEYLNGGDCATLIKVLGGLPEGWTQKYIAEVVVAVDELHKRGIVHRDLKPENLLIDSEGHLKLIDFGLSRMGAVGRHIGGERSRAGSSSPIGTQPSSLNTVPVSRTTTVSSALEDVVPESHSVGSSGGHSGGSSLSGSNSAGPVSALHDPTISLVPGYFSLGSGERRGDKRIASLTHRHESSGSEATDDNLSHTSSNDHISSSPRGSGSVSGNASNFVLFDPLGDNQATKRFVGTPDYLAPETIRGFGQDEMSDWWSLGCILFEFLYGYPPFHAETPNKVFQNILDRNIQWPDSQDEIGEDGEPIASPEAKDLINRLLCSDPTLRLGINGIDQIKEHAFFGGVNNWDTLWEDEASFIPAVENPENTDYFDSRGAVMEEFEGDADVEPETRHELHQALQQATSGHADSSDESSTSVTNSKTGGHDSLHSSSGDHNSPSKRDRPQRVLPLHIPPHVREGRSRRLSEPVPVNDFGSFAFKNLPVLERANKELINKMKLESLDHQREVSRGSKASLKNVVGSPLQSISTASSPSPNSSRHSSPTRQLSSAHSSSAQRLMPMGTGSGSGSSSSTAMDSPQKIAAVPSLKTSARSEDGSYFSSSWGDRKQSSVGSVSEIAASCPRRRGLSNMDSNPELEEQFRQRKFSNVFDMSPSGSDNDEPRPVVNPPVSSVPSTSNAALIRVQKRRAMSRKVSRSSMGSIRTGSGDSLGNGVPILDILVCDVNPVWRYSVERMLVKVGCRVVSVGTGQEAIRRATGGVKFDVVIVEYKLGNMVGADVARLIHNTMNANLETPIVCLTSLSELPEELKGVFGGHITRPPTEEKLVKMLKGLYPGWKVKGKSNKS